MRNIRSKTFDDIVFNMAVGSISKVFAENDSTFTIIKLNKHTPAMYRPLSEVAEHIEARLLRQRQREIADAFLARIRDETEIKIFLPEAGEDKPQREDESKLEQE